jgi:hypothetical protein
MPVHLGEHELAAVSLHQPWAIFMALGLKRWETRSWATTHRGPLVICASKGIPAYAWEFLRQSWVLSLLREHRVELGDVDRTAGHALAVVSLVETVRTPDITRDAIADMSHATTPGRLEAALGNYGPRRWAWQTAGLRRFAKPFPASGRHGVWPISRALVEAALVEGAAP